MIDKDIEILNEEQFKTTINKDKLDDAFKNVDFSLNELIDAAVKAKYKDNELKSLKYIIKRLKQENSKLKIEIKDLKNEIGFLEIDRFRFNNLASEEMKRRQTYKKIAEKLVEKIKETGVYENICNNTYEGKCNEIKGINCNNCILEWARKEVENETN